MYQMGASLTALFFKHNAFSKADDSVVLKISLQLSVVAGLSNHWVLQAIHY